MKYSIYILAALLGVSLSGAALADPPHGKGKGHGKNHDKIEMRHDRDERVVIRDDGRYHFRDDDRVVIREYYRDNCPPGLAKKNNGCLPPGQAKKYGVGQRLPEGVIFQPLPSNLVARLGRPPAGYSYVINGGDVLLVSDTERTIMDVVSIFGALAR